MPGRRTAVVSHRRVSFPSREAVPVAGYTRPLPRMASIFVPSLPEGRRQGGGNKTKIFLERGWATGYDGGYEWLTSKSAESSSRPEQAAGPDPSAPRLQSISFVSVTRTRRFTTGRFFRPQREEFRSC